MRLSRRSQPDAYRFHAKNLLDKLWQMGSIEFAKALAAFVIFQVKESVEGCGKLTSLLSIHQGKSEYTRPSQLLKLEHLFLRYPFAERDLFDFVFGMMPEDEAKLLWKGTTKNAGLLRKEAVKIMQATQRS
jgi:hypothetical protein